MAKYHYLLFIRQDDFIDLFKFGRLYTPGKCVEFDGDLDSVKYDRDKAQRIFDEVNDFEYSNEYFLLHVAADRQLSRGRRFEMSDVVNIIALDEDSYRIGLSLSPAVKLTPPIWQEFYQLSQEKQVLYDTEIGVKNIGEIFDVNFAKVRRNRRFPAHKDDTTFQDVIHDKLNGTPIGGEHSIWYYVLRYERHQSYPDDNRGYLLDVLHIYANFLKKKDIDMSLIKHPIGQSLMEQNKDIEYGALCNFIPFTEKIYQDTEKIFKGFINVTILYLMMKDIFADGLNPDKLYKGRYLEEFVNETDILFPGSKNIIDYALYLLGFSLGRANTYKYIYMTNKNKFRVLA